MANPTQNNRSRARRRGASRFAARRRLAGVFAALTVMVTGSATLLAQLDPLLFIKRVPPTIIIVMDTSLRMLEDGSGTFYDPSFYKVSDDLDGHGRVSEHRHRDDEDLPAEVHATFSTRRPGQVLGGLDHRDAAAWDPANPLTSTDAGDAAYLDPTRYSVAKRGVAAAVW